MGGRIKRGEGTLIGDAGEFAVMSELLKQGVMAALAPRNAPWFDILATNGQKTVRIRVKTKSIEYDGWQWNVLKDDFAHWVAEPGVREGKPHDPSNKRRILWWRKFGEQMAAYRDWEILWK